MATCYTNMCKKSTFFSFKYPLLFTISYYTSCLWIRGPIKKRLCSATIAYFIRLSSLLHEEILNIELFYANKRNVSHNTLNVSDNGILYVKSIKRLSMYNLKLTDYNLSQKLIYIATRMKTLKIIFH